MKTKHARPKVIAELGINWNGDFNLLKRMARKALLIGADYVKLQTRTPKVCVPQDQWDTPRTWFDGTDVTYIEYKERMELSQEQLFAFGKEFEGRWFTSVWDEESVDFIYDTFKNESFYLPHYLKIPSAKMVDAGLIGKVQSTGLPMMISTGMSSREEIERMFEWLDKNRRIILFHCNSSYPTADEEINLAAISSLGWAAIFHALNNCEVGFSSHSKSPFPCIGAMYVGAKWIEVHFTLDRTMQGTDQAASLEPNALELLVREARRLPVVMGDGDMKVYDSELSARKKLRGV